MSKTKVRQVDSEEFARIIGRTLKHTRLLLAQGRVVGAKKIGRVWSIPENARIKGKGHVLDYGEREGLTPTQYGKKHGASRHRVYDLLYQGRIEGAVHTEHGWDIPPDAPWPADSWNV